MGSRPGKMTWTELHVLRMLDAVALQRAKVIPVPELSEECLENHPVPIAAGGTVVPLQMSLDVGLDVVVVEKCIVDIDQKDDGVR